MNNKYPKTKIQLNFAIVETSPGKHTVAYTTEENDTTMKEVGLLLYKIKQVEQELIDREWDNGGEGFEVCSEGNASY